ncbi:hypothetical protein ACQ33O_05320 [Ferruginibacter sp. SUN002]|uniref:hypothetical protein n=1 Tax=Ferruginibacter sp. SUN002 TaxID=2937789 RepID=UPI003D35FAA4
MLKIKDFGYTTDPLIKIYSGNKKIIFSNQLRKEIISTDYRSDLSKGSTKYTLINNPTHSQTKKHPYQMRFIGEMLFTDLINLTNNSSGLIFKNVTAVTVFYINYFS